VDLINWFGQEGGLNPAKIWTLTARRTFALHRAAEAGSTEMVEAMIKLGVGEYQHFVKLLIHMWLSIGMSGLMKQVHTDNQLSCVISVFRVHSAHV